MTSPLLKDFPEGRLGSTIEMYFWPNSVVGRISMSMFSGMFLAADGTSATLMTACFPSLPISRTWPTRAPCRRTSPNLASCRPALSALIVTIVGWENALL